MKNKTKDLKKMFEITRYLSAIEKLNTMDEARLIRLSIILKLKQLNITDTEFEAMLKLIR